MLRCADEYTPAFLLDELRANHPDLQFFTVSADADRNGNQHIDNDPDEYRELREENRNLANLYGVPLVGSIAARTIVDTYMYRLLATTQLVGLSFHGDSILEAVVATLDAVPTAGFVGNDTLVTISSAQGAGPDGFGQIATPLVPFTGLNGRNHSSVADGGVAQQVLPNLFLVEYRFGDLKPE